VKNRHGKAQLEKWAYGKGARLPSRGGAAVKPVKAICSAMACGLI